jgi:hypothetical protein
LYVLPVSEVGVTIDKMRDTGRLIHLAEVETQRRLMAHVGEGIYFKFFILFILF